MKIILNNKRTSGKNTICDLKIYYRAILIKLYINVTLTDMSIMGIVSETQKYNHTLMDTCSLIKKLKLYNGQRKASAKNGAGITGNHH